MQADDPCCDAEPERRGTASQASPLGTSASPLPIASSYSTIKDDIIASASASNPSVYNTNTGSEAGSIDEPPPNLSDLVQERSWNFEDPPGMEARYCCILSWTPQICAPHTDG